MFFKVTSEPKKSLLVSRRLQKSFFVLLVGSNWSSYFQEEITQLTKEMAQKFGKKRYIANLGHGITPKTPLESMKAFTEAIHEAL